MDKKIRQQQIFDWKKHPMSWSQIASWNWNKEEWFEKYILNKPQPDTAELRFGKLVGGKLEKDPTFLPQIPRHSKMEHEFRVNLGGIELLGFADSFCTKTNKKLLEYKTANTKNAWTQDKVDNHHQLTMYILMNFITNKIKPEDMLVELVWMPTKKEESGNFEVNISFVEPIENNIQIFSTKRTMVQILKFAKEIMSTHKKMEKYAKVHK